MNGGAGDPILVTGAHRSGTTWAGKILAANPETAYISEPLNVLHRAGVFSAPIRHWYTYICHENEGEYLPALQETLGFQYHTLAEVRSLRSRKDFLRMGRDWSTFLRGRITGLIPLIKDPFAVFSAPWFAERLNCKVVVTVRHPAAFASSLKRLKWSFDFNDLLQQPHLMRDWLEPFRQPMEEMQRSPEDIIGQSSLLWQMIYLVVASYHEQNSTFQVVRHEDLSIQPVEAYRRLYTALGLTFSPGVEKTIFETSSTDNPAELSKGSVHSFHLDSRANLRNWKHRLEADEIKRIRSMTEGVACRYYSSEDWD